jgi:peptidyl-dipeptidase Dcp
MAGAAFGLVGRPAWAAAAGRIDVHGHLVPDFYRQAAIGAGEIKPSGMPAWPAWDVNLALATMDRLQIAAQMLSIPPPGVYFGDPVAARNLARAVNDAGAAAVAAHPARFGLLACIPLPDIDASLREIEYALDTLHADGIALLTQYQGLHLGNARFEAVFAELDRRGATVFIHPTAACAACSGDMPYPAPLIEFMFETTRAVTFLLFSGTLARHPHIRFIVPHAGAAVPTLSDRLVGTIPALGLENPPSAAAVATLLRGLHYDLAGFVVPNMLPSLLNVAPVGQLLYGTDWPFTPEPAVRHLAQLLDGTPSFDAAERGLILRDNALRLFPRLASPQRTAMAWPALGIAVGVAAGTAATAAELAPSNPFHSPSSLPLGAPPFDKISNADFQPAIEAGMAEQLREIQAIADDPAAATFKNTLVPLEQSGQLLGRALAAFHAVAAANTTAELEKVKSVLAPKLAAHHDAIYLNAQLFARVSQVYRRRDGGGLDPESRRLLEITHGDFVREGANLSETDKQKLKELNTEASTLSDDFGRRLLAATRDSAYSTTDRAALAGESDARLAAFARVAKERQVEGYVVPLENTTQQSVLESLENRDVRRAIFENSWNRTERGDANDTRAIVARLAQLRAERAALLGFPSHAAWKLQDQMAKTPQAALDFMARLVPLATARAGLEAKDLQAAVDASGGGFTLEPWDWDRYSDPVSRAKFNLDPVEIKPYFELNNVLENGVFYAATRLYGITFHERRDLPVYQADVRVFDVLDGDGTLLGLFYGDYFKRDNKSGGAWMSHFVDQSKLLGKRPVVYNVANLPQPAPGEPALISFDDVITMFHEFGHALHGLFADTQYPSLSGTATPRDFVEFPSQFNEHWATYPDVFNHFARHHQTGEVMPAALRDKIQGARHFNQGYAMTELLAAAELDMQWHSLPSTAPLQNPDAFELKALAKAHLDLAAVPPRYRSSYFRHIWEGGYSAGYYAYLWTQMVADDAYQWFEQQGGMTRANGDRFRHIILSRGNTEDLANLYARWRGRPPKVDAMLIHRGLASPSQ